MIALLHRTEGGFGNVFLVLAALAAAMLATSLFFPSNEALAASKLRAAAQPSTAA
jgi:hypothetical protein